MEDLRDLCRPLSVDQIDFRIQSINNGGYATILAYKDARVDMQRLDEVVGPLRWKREHRRDNYNCIVSIWDEKLEQWVSKEDTGTESFTEPQKGLASDSFKRACFNWGIGRELYDYPMMQVKLNADEWQKGENGKPNRATWKLQLKSWRWISCPIGKGLAFLEAKDQDGTVRFEYHNPEVIRSTADYFIGLIIDDQADTLAESWSELSEGEKRALWLAETKGGFFSQEQKKYIRTATSNIKGE